MHLVLNAPIAANSVGKGLGCLPKRGNVVAGFAGHLYHLGAMHLPFGLHSNQGLQAGKRWHLVEVMTDANGAFLNPTVPLIDLLHCLLGLEMGLHRTQQSRLIALECTQVMILALHNRLSRFFGC